MGFELHEPEQRAGLVEVMTAADITVAELWLAYFSMGGSAGEYEVEAYVEGLLSLSDTERDLLAMAANELIGNTAAPHAPSAAEIAGPGPGCDGSGSDGDRRGNTT